MKRSLITAALLCFCAAGCAEERATQKECRAILERIVEIELTEMGFDDPVLAARWKSESAARHASELSACIGKPLPEGAMACVARATTTEALSHECLR